MLDEIERLKGVALAEIEAAVDLGAVEELRVRHLGRKSPLRDIMSSIGDLTPQERPAVGKATGEAQSAIRAALESQVMRVEQAIGDESFDVTLPGRRPQAGKLHPLGRLADELIDIFRLMGFSVADGPEIEDDYHNFDALNTPADHPARDLHDTFYLNNGKLLRTHTSPVQIRVMELVPPPVKVIALGRCYRRDTVDATHHFAFHQIEGLSVDEGMSMADLKGTLEQMGRQLLGHDTKVRFRPHFFPFTEPSVEYDFSCSICSSSSSRCRVCKGTGWIEIGGAGLVDPAVFEAVGYDPEKYVGFAFGMGLERMAMILHGIDDIRLFLENDLRFTRRF